MRFVYKFHFEFFRKKKKKMVNFTTNNRSFRHETIDETDLIVMGRGRWRKIRMLSSIIDRIDFSTCRLEYRVRSGSAEWNAHTVTQTQTATSRNRRPFSLYTDIDDCYRKRNGTRPPFICDLCRSRNTVITLRVFRVSIWISILQLEW